MHAEDGVIPFPDAKTSDDVFCVWAYYDATRRSAIIEVEGPKRHLFVPVDFPLDDLNEIVITNKLEGIRTAAVRFLDKIDFNDKLKALFLTMTDEDKDWHRAEHKRRINRLQAYAKMVIDSRKNKH
jgi:hypothetical protein